MELSKPAIVTPPQNLMTARSVDDPFFANANHQLSDKGFFVASADSLIAWARTGSLMWMQFGLACCAIEMMQMSMPRYDAERVRLRSARKSAPIRCDDRSRNACQQDGPGAPQSIRPDARTALCDLHGLVRERRRLLPLLLFGGARLQRICTSRYLRARLSADGRGTALRCASVTEEDSSHRHD